MFHDCTLYEFQREKSYLPTYAYNKDLSAHLRSLVRVFVCPHGETLHPWLSKMCPVKIQIRLRECRRRADSSLGVHMSEGTFSDVAAHVIFYCLPWRTSTTIPVAIEKGTLWKYRFK